MTRRSTQLARAVTRIEGICAGHDDERALRIALVAEIGRAVPFDAYAWLLTDPETEVGSAPLADVPALPDLPRLIRAKYLTELNRWTALDRAPVSLSITTGGRLDRSHLWTEVLSRHAIDDVASVVLRDPFGCWAWLDLWRARGKRPFDQADLEYLEQISAPVVLALRQRVARTFHEAATAPARAGPVILVLSPELDVRAQSAETDDYLRALAPTDPDRRPIPAGAYNVAAQLLATEAGIDEHPPWCRVHLVAGTWVTLRAARMHDAEGTGDADIAVTIEPASPAERRSLFARSHGLSPRETELVDLLAEGADARDVARRLFVSEHTVQDHLKSIFTKTGARNRRTLLARCAGR